MEQAVREDKNGAILVFSDEFPPDGGGAGVVARQLALDLQTMHRDFTLLTGATKGQRVSETALIEVSRPTLLWPLMYFFRLIKLQADKFQIIILNDYVAAYIAGIFFSKELLAKSTILVHGEDAEFFLARNSLKHKIFRYRFSYKRALRHCNRVIASSRYARDEFLRQAAELINPAKVEYAYMGINPALMGTQTVFRKSDIGLPEGAILLFTASRLVKEKGLLTMLEHFRKATSGNNHLHWHIAGEGPLRPQLEERIRAYGLREKVVLLGRLDRKNLANYYGLADVFWLLSRRKAETFGLVYIEAAYYGTPSIGLRYAGVPEAIREGVSGYFMDDEDSLATLIAQCLELDRETCRDFANSFLSISFAENLVNNK